MSGRSRDLSSQSASKLAPNCALAIPLGLAEYPHRAQEELRLDRQTGFKSVSTTSFSCHQDLCVVSCTPVVILIFLNEYWTRSPAFSFYIGPHWLCGQFCLSCILGEKDIRSITLRPGCVSLISILMPMIQESSPHFLCLIRTLVLLYLFETKLGYVLRILTKT